MSLATNLQSLATRMATECKALRTLINGNLADLSALTTTAKTSLVAAINEVKAAQGSSVIDDATTGTLKTWSSSKINTSINSATAALVNSAPATLDTLNELAAALGSDPAFATTMTTALGKRVRVDAAQVFTAGEQTQARANIGAQEAALIGDPATDFVATFNAGLV
jgi:phosphopantothenoylcysteine synthetase/decarboxylase